MICKKCGKKTIGEALFCAFCGERMAETCSSCGAELNTDALFCHKCGTKVTTKEDESAKTNVLWDEENNRIIVRGKGDMPSYFDSYRKRPWLEYAKDCREIVIEEGITNIGAAAFRDFDYLYEVKIAPGVTKICAEAFRHCTDLQYVYLPKSVQSMGYNAFDDCDKLRVIFYEGSQEDWGNIEFSALSLCNNPTIYYNSSLNAENN